MPPLLGKSMKCKPWSNELGLGVHKSSPVDVGGTFVDSMRLRAACGGCMLDLSATEIELNEELQSCLLAANQVKLKALSPDNCVRLLPPILLLFVLLQRMALGNGILRFWDSGRKHPGCVCLQHRMITRPQNRRNHAMTLQKYPQTRQTPRGKEGRKIKSKESQRKTKVNVAHRDGEGLNGANK